MSWYSLLLFSWENDRRPPWRFTRICLRNLELSGYVRSWRTPGRIRVAPCVNVGFCWRLPGELPWFTSRISRETLWRAAEPLDPNFCDKPRPKPNWALPPLVPMSYRRAAPKCICFTQHKGQLSWPHSCENPRKLRVFVRKSLFSKFGGCVSCLLNPCCQNLNFWGNAQGLLGQ